MMPEPPAPYMCARCNLEPATKELEALGLWYCESCYKIIIDKFTSDIKRHKTGVTVVAISNQAPSIWYGLLLEDNEKTIILRPCVNLYKSKGYEPIGISKVIEKKLNKKYFKITKIK